MAKLNENTRRFRAVAEAAQKAKYTLDAGRCIVKDGVPIATLHGCGAYDPTEMDIFAHNIVNALNR